MNTLVDVLVEEDGSEVIQVAKIVSETKKKYHIKFLSPHTSGLYRYDKDPIEIDKECISGFYDSTEEKDAGFIRVENGYYQPIEQYDDDYEPSEDDSDTDESLVESDFEDEEENIEE